MREPCVISVAYGEPARPSVECQYCRGDAAKCPTMKSPQASLAIGATEDQAVASRLPGDAPTAEMLAQEAKRLLRKLPAGALRPTLDNLIAPVITHIDRLATLAQAGAEGPGDAPMGDVRATIETALRHAAMYYHSGEEFVSADDALAAFDRLAAQEPVAWVNRNELDNMLDDRTATVQGQCSGWRRTPLFLAALAQAGAEGTQERAVAAQAIVDAERERCAAWCDDLASMMEGGAAEARPGGRLRQAARHIRKGLAARASQAGETPEGTNHG